MIVRPEDLASTWGRCFAGAVAEVAVSLCHQDAYEVWDIALDCELTVAALRAVDDAALERLKYAAVEWLELEGFTVEQMRNAVDDTIWNYPEGGGSVA